MPFWQTNVIYNECCCFIDRNGNITAKLKFAPKAILSVRDWTLEKEYVEGKDYTFDAATNTFTWLADSDIPYFTENFLAGRNEDGSQIDAFTAYDQHPWSTLGYARFKDAIYCIGPELYEKQVFVTYEYDQAEFVGVPTPFLGAQMPGTMEKLLNKQQLSVIVYGDSIPVGCDSSKMYNRAPYQDGFPDIFRNALQEVYGGKVKLRNTSVGGTTSEWAFENVEDKVIRYKPDLVLLMTGGNDGNTNGLQTKVNVYKTVQKIQQELPGCEIILMDCFVANPDSGFDVTVKPLLGGLYNEIAQQFDGVISLDIWNLHTYMLQDKNYIDFSGNGVNHPNDYMIRLYAQQLLSALVDFEGLARQG